MDETVVDMKELMFAGSRIPADPVPSSPAEAKGLLIDQIMEFQQRYLFAGVQHDRESLALKPVAYLERLNDMQLYGIASSRVTDRLLSGTRY